MRNLSSVVMVVSLAGCAQSPRPNLPAVEQLTSMRDAADAGEVALGVPADLTLAVAYAETRWQSPVGHAHAHGRDAHMPLPVGVGGLKPWLGSNLVERASALLEVDASVIARDPRAGILATAAALYELARERHGEMPAVEDLGAWHEAVADYSGLADAVARRSYVAAVFGYLERGVQDTAADGREIVLAARTVTLPSFVAPARGYGGAEYPGALWTAADPSNYSSRDGTAIDRVVIHTTQGSYSGTISWFRNPSSNVSAHYVVRSSDGQITQMVSEARKAWHATVFNSRSIGIEHEGWVEDPGRWYTDAMYRASADLTRYLCDKYGIPIDRTHIVGHVEVPGATHTDPGSGWDWDRYIDMVRGTPPGPPFDAEYVGQDVSAEMVAGERAVAWVELKNLGSTTWSLDGTRLGTASPHDHDSPFYDEENWLSANRATPPDHSTYGRDAVGRFTFMITAPEVTETTTITDTFQLVQEGVEWFGPEVTLSVVVHPRDAAVPDVDLDGSSAGVDCDDNDASVFPGAAEICEDGIDQDCSGADLACTGEIPVDPTDPIDPVTPVDGDMTLRGGCRASGDEGPASLAWVIALASLAPVLRRRRR